jgi:hypothetical protein
MEPITLPLPATKTHGCREIHWQPVHDPKPNPLFRLLGVLTITESVKPTTKVKVSRYLVAGDKTSDPGTRYLLTKAGGREQHFVELEGNGVYSWHTLCDCRGYEAGHHCRHIQALEALEKAGQLTTTDQGATV